ncbi:Hint domain-containing protein [Falsirhodobacter sp. alg1]|uniref:Hint domain-containing protein n=1 Tax=Falsirhodobacter sp. alg1 TaxID=1472418 RepID=UPI0007893173|nr:Hint domain-containing protein [Falsirhodobacter sp. alg1]
MTSSKYNNSNDCRDDDKNHSNGIVDGKETGEYMGVGYTDAQGDRITNGADKIVANGGNDYIDAGGGNDLVYGGSGNDTILGGTGNDTLSGDAGNDVLIGGDGCDLIVGGDGDDKIYGGDDADKLYGNDGNDYISGGSGNDLIYGGKGNDTIEGGTGNDTVYGGEGNDVWLDNGLTTSGSDAVYLEDGDDYAQVGYFTSPNPDTLDGGAGNDTVAFNSDSVDCFDLGITLNDDGTSKTINFNSIVNNFENVVGNSGNNQITGNSADNKIWGMSGNDSLNGRGGNDTIDGGSGNDTIIGGKGNDVLTGGKGSDTFIYAHGDGFDKITDFNTGDTADKLNDGDSSNNDFIDLSKYYDKLSELRADFDDDGILNQSNGINAGGTVDYSNNETFGSGDGIAFTSGTRDIFTQDSTGVVCFARGTMIETISGQVAIEDLEAGDLVRTMDRGFRPISWIGGRKMDSIDLLQHPRLLPIRIVAGALGAGLPKADLVVSPQHRILVRSAIAERMFGEREVLVAANKLLTVDGIDIVEDATEVEYFHMLFDQHEIVFSNGAASESLFTGPEAMKAVSPEARQEILTLFPEIMEPEFTSEPARFIPEKGKFMKKLAQRHHDNRKALFEA